jgi:hypothetical protein
MRYGVFFGELMARITATLRNYVASTMSLEQAFENKPFLVAELQVESRLPRLW